MAMWCVINEDWVKAEADQDIFLLEDNHQEDWGGAGHHEADDCGASIHRGQGLQHFTFWDFYGASEQQRATWDR